MTFDDDFLDGELMTGSAWVPDFTSNPEPEQETECEAAVDSLGIKYTGTVLAGLVTPMDAALRSSTRGNPLDPFNLEQEVEARQMVTED